MPTKHTAVIARHRRPFAARTKAGGLLLATAVLAGGALVQAAQAKASTAPIVVDSLSVSATPDGQLKATTRVHATKTIKVQALAVAARSAGGGAFDFPGAAPATLSTSPTTYTSGSRAFPAGTYTYFVSYKLHGIWYRLSPVNSFTAEGGSASTPSGTPTVTASPSPTVSTPTPTPTPTATRTATSTPTASSSTSDAPLGVPGTWRNVFDDEFNGTSLDGSKWNPNWLGCSGCTTKPVNSGELSAYSPSQVSVSGGNLHLKAVQQSATVNGTTYPYVSGLVESNGKAQFTYGAFEARIYTPASGTQIANWPAFWTDGQNWPTDGEMDVMEGLGGSACYHFHSPAGGPGGCASGSYTGWHTYGAEWAPGSVTYYYDGKQVGRITTGITSAPMYLILNNAVSSTHGGPTQVPADMMVDYVKVWQH
ncbi:glycoside hydrolase family 16 protein [Streptomyces griseorubiginosus]|uniref:glycoside hydrolase family 16 protein n=1 Tax=Streptomyces griseorubiginosus TaxID=67304 RepID=UPI001AD74C3D|nr:glycoside hydrolase family 16 protein [Streptomyces griseorubiginosus]MBO4253479.1 family 16 glycosylhydrolase [Streptomyces griseorubiginosus]